MYCMFICAIYMRQYDFFHPPKTQLHLLGGHIAHEQNYMIKHTWSYSR